MKIAILGLVAVWLAWAGLSPAAPVATQAVYVGMCDASAAVALNNELFAVANDEDNSLRIYHAAKGGLPVASQDLSGLLKVDRKKPETDLEGACWSGDYIYWISSHGRNRDGKFRASRHRFFATQVEQSGGQIQVRGVGRVYVNLLADLLRDPRLRRFGLDRAGRLPPKAAGGLNIEGLCATPENTLLIGFRNPLPQKRALILPMLNPGEVINGRMARFGDPLLLDLGGRGVREIVRWGNRYVIVGGAYDGNENSKLFEWMGGSAQPRELSSITFTNFNPEAIIVYPDTNRPFQVLSDDGTVLINGVACKSVANANLKKFRAAWVSLPIEDQK